ncbi:hypothetical protein WJX74_007362 [Apatococcus lobatus]|uniref:Uncharacterized protein n=1 Tax=Apatococcus lobatus TaxID=904363 RepID=A0AAW1RSK4_9CHLO
MPSTAHRDRKAAVRQHLQSCLDRYPSWTSERNGRPAKLSYKRKDGTLVELQSMHAMPGGPPLNVWVPLPDVLLTGSTAVEDFVQGASSVCLMRPEVHLFHRGFRPYCPGCKGKSLNCKGWGDLRTVHGLNGPLWISIYGCSLTVMNAQAAQTNNVLGPPWTFWTSWNMDIEPFTYFTSAGASYLLDWASRTVVEGGSPGDLSDAMKEMRHLRHARQGEAYFETQACLKEAQSARVRQSTITGCFQKVPEQAACKPWPAYERESPAASSLSAAILAASAEQVELAEEDMSRISAKIYRIDHSFKLPKHFSAQSRGQAAAILSCINEQGLGPQAVYTDWPQGHSTVLKRCFPDLGKGLADWDEGVKKEIAHVGFMLQRKLDMGVPGAWPFLTGYLRNILISRGSQRYAPPPDAMFKNLSE